MQKNLVTFRKINPNVSAKRDSVRPRKGTEGSKRQPRDPLRRFYRSETPEAAESESAEANQMNNGSDDFKDTNSERFDYIQQLRRDKEIKLIEKNERTLGRDHWRGNDSHYFSFIGIFLFSLILYFRPYELIPALKGYDSMALIAAIATLLLYLPSQLNADGRLTVFTTEVKCILFLAVSALVTIPLAVDAGMAWKTYSEYFIKIVVIFVILVNTLRTRSRLLGLMWLSIGVGVLLSYQALELYQRGIFETEGYRVSVDFGGMFGNPNDMAIHLVVFMPVAFALGIASRKRLAKLVYFASAGIMVAGNVVTQSRGGFLGLMAVAGVLVWKLGKKHRFRTVVIASVATIIFMTVTPGNYGVRMMSIFIPSLDPVGSSQQRKEALQRSIVVTLRNPLGIGMGNSPIVGVQEHETHNAYTQVSSELGWLAIAAYLIFLITPFRKLGAIERLTHSENDHSWIYYMSIGLQASIAGYMVSSFFGSVAYQWYVYYPIAYAVCLRRIYHTERAVTSNSEDRAKWPEYNNKLLQVRGSL